MPPKHGRQKAFQCAICENAFPTKAELNRHMETYVHRPAPAGLICEVCKWDFDDSHALELHKVQTGHATLNFACENCNQRFVSQKGLANHLRLSHECMRAPKETNTDIPIFCDRCEKSFSTRKRFNQHRSDLASECADWRHKTTSTKQTLPIRQSCVDLGKPKQDSRYGDEYTTQDSNASTNTSNGGIQCKDCKKKFASQGQYDNHFLGCTPVPFRFQSIQHNVNDKHKATETIPAPEVHSPKNTSNVKTRSMTKAEASKAISTSKTASKENKLLQLQSQQAPSVASTSVSNTDAYPCDCSCAKIFNSAFGRAQHKAAIHNVNIHDSDFEVLSKKQKKCLQQEALLKAPSAPARSAKGNNTPTELPSRFASGANSIPLGPSGGSKSNNTSSGPPPRFASGSNSVPLGPARPTAPHIAPTQPNSMPTTTGIGSATDIEQARQIQARALRLLIQSDIFIHYDGKISVGGLEWNRIGVEKHLEAVSKLDSMCHLPKVLQGEYLPAPKTFTDEYNAYYNLTNFNPSPTRDPEKPGLSVVVLSCSKVTLANGCHEVVKIAAIDLTTTGILMNHFVCTDPNAQVAKWDPDTTGISGWRNMEDARRAGYKVFKGWSAARTALHRYIDSDTIIVGYNLRSDLDALRMIHGRAVDIAKVVEKAANGRLSKAQLSLDSMCRDYMGVKLSWDPEFGRDCLLDAFAIRQFGLWVIKNREKFEKGAKQKSIEYQRALPASTVAAAATAV